MKTLLLPVDFSDTSRNAADFALHWAKRYGYERIILVRSLYHSYFEDLATSSEYMLLSQAEKARFYDDEKDQLDGLCQQLASTAGPGIRVFTALSEQPLVRALLQLVEQEKPELIIAGSDNREYESDSYISARLIELARASPVRVLVVPAGCPYRELHAALVPCNLAQIDSLVRLLPLTQTPYSQELQLEVLHIDTPDRSTRPKDPVKAMTQLREYLKNFNYRFHRRSAATALQGIHEYIAGAGVQLIVALPGRHSFLYALTHRSVSEALYRNTQLPVLVLK